MLELPLIPEPGQMLSAVLGGQNCRFFIYQKDQGLFLDLVVNGVNVAVGVICRNEVLLIAADYIGFIGNLMFTDTQGLSDPMFGELGTRYVLLYLEPSEVAVLF